MTKIKAGAIQPAYLPIAEPFDCTREDYLRDARAVTDGYAVKNLEVSLRLLEEAGKKGCDVVTTSEDVSGLGNFLIDASQGNIFGDLVALNCGIVEERVSSIAKKYRMNIIACYYKKMGGKIYNIASAFNRDGAIIGAYKKTHLPAYEKWLVAEGEELNVIDADFGRMGICICYDMVFPGSVACEALKGAKIIFHPTLGYGWYESIGEATLRARANDHSVYIVTAKNYLFNQPGKSSVVDPWGHVLADAGYQKDALVYAQIDPAAPKDQPDWYYPVPTTKVKDVGRRIDLERRPDLYGALTETRPRLRDLNPEEQKHVIGLIRRGKCRW